MAASVDDVGGRHVEGEIEDLEAEVEARADLVDRGAAGREVLEHLPVDLGRIGRDAARRDAVACGEDRDERSFDRRRRLALPGGEPFDEPFEPAEAAGGLRQVALALAHRRGRGLVRAGHHGYQSAHVVERRAAAPRGSSGLLERRGERQGRGASIGGTRAGVKRCP